MLKFRQYEHAKGEYSVYRMNNEEDYWEDGIFLADIKLNKTIFWWDSRVTLEELKEIVAFVEKLNDSTK